jgi:hypothetical protein
MNFTDLEIFKAVVDEGGIIKASRKLHRGALQRHLADPAARELDGRQPVSP